MQFLKERNLLKKTISYCFLAFLFSHHQLKCLSLEQCSSLSGETGEWLAGVRRGSRVPWLIKSSHAETNPVDGECCRLLGKQCKSRGILGMSIASGSGFLPPLAPCCYIACISVPLYLCHKSMALVTMASVFSCGIWKKG